MKQRLDFLLTRQPILYAAALRLRPASLDKRVFLRLVRPGDSVFDVGANLGHYTVLFSHLAGRNGEVHAFEPIPSTFDRLSANVAARARFGNVRLNRAAVSDRPGPVTLWLPGDDHGQASLARHRAGSWTPATEVREFSCEAVRLDDYVRERGTGQVAFVKCDVEGAELPALRGAAETLKRHRPLLHLEVSAAWTGDFGYDPADLIRFLLDLGYRSFHLLREDVRRLDDPLTELGGLQESVNLLCAVPEVHGERIRFLSSWEAA